MRPSWLDASLTKHVPAEEKRRDRRAEQALARSDRRQDRLKFVADVKDRAGRENRENRRAGRRADL